MMRGYLEALAILNQFSIKKPIREIPANSNYSERAYTMGRSKNKYGSTKPSEQGRTFFWKHFFFETTRTLFLGLKVEARLRGMEKRYEKR